MFQLHHLRQRSHAVALIILVFVVATMTFFSNTMAKRLAEDERNKMRVWAEAYRVLGSESANDESNSLALEIITNNETIPLLIINQVGNITSRNIKLPKKDVPAFLGQKLQEYMSDSAHEPIDVSFNVGGEVYSERIYYGRSILLRRLSFFPVWQVSIIAFFLVIAYFFFNISKRSEENRVWVGLSKETAHQLGTPISSLLAWIDLMRSGHMSHEMADEMEKDVNRLRIVANRFSKIGSKPTLTMFNLSEVMADSSNYMSSRITKKVKIVRLFDAEAFVPVMLNVELFEWVIENLIKNAVDAMRGGGSITINIEEDDKVAEIEITDEGKGIPKKKFEEIFRPGYSSKKRGWGLGLSFSKRIVKDYHGGKIFVEKSEIDVGSTFRIILPKCEDENHHADDFSSIEEV